MSKFSFQLIKKDSKTSARRGQFSTPHGVVQTPVFMPVGTFATVKSLSQDDLLTLDSPIILGNTYHLLLRPGAEVFRKFGGIHNFMKWPKPLLTDSGGFQIFSLPKDRKITEEGATFRSYLDGQLHVLSPEASIAMQNAIGSDIMMVLDVCIDSTSDFSTTQAAMEQTHRWALRSLRAKEDFQVRNPEALYQALFAIVQGGTHEKLRQQSADFLTKHPFDGFAIGGLAVGETKHERETFTEIAAGLLPEDKPRYLMGVGTPVDLLEAVKRGVDMFDCIIPTKMAQQGVVYTSSGQETLTRGFFKFSDDPVDSKCSCSTCKKYSRGYLHHLSKCKETLGWTLLSIHNVHYYLRLMEEARAAIEQDRYLEFYKQRIDEIGAPTYDLVRAKNGAAAVKHLVFNEIMHSVVGPWEEANKLYVDQSQLETKLFKGQSAGVSNSTKNIPLVLFDVGLGAGTNAIAAIHRQQIVKQKNANEVRPLTIFSFENDLSALKLVIDNLKEFPHSAPYAHTLKAIYETGIYQDENLTWHLVKGDFTQTLNQVELAPDIIFYDPFSPKNNSAMWSYEIFQTLKDLVARNLTPSGEAKHCDLFTYSLSTQVRVGMLMAGWYVGSGFSTGPKADTTHASTHFENLANPLHPHWLEKWARSQAQLPFSKTQHEFSKIKEVLMAHDQWKKAVGDHWVISPAVITAKLNDQQASTKTI